MRLGTSLRSAYGVDDPRAGAQMMIDRAIAARDAGLDSLFVGDHHATGPFPYYQNIPIMARLLAEWSDAPVAGVLMLLPLWHPVLAAEQIGTLASLAQGRFVLQCALGGGDQQFEAMGHSVKHRVSQFEGALDIIRRLLAGDEVTVTDGPFRVEAARIAPVTPEPLEVWIGASAPRAIDRAARLGDGWIAGPELTRAEAREQAALYVESCEKHGRAPGVVAIRRDVHVGADAADAERVAGPVVAAGYRGFRPEACTIGGVPEILAQLMPFAEMGYTDVIVRHLAEDHAEVLRSFERLATVREAIAGA
jgi:alkanesulfonate monooxygenase SsuD/methylene tetrahydromethanopterin reductase-like flavin-dependent oxidoreductase (luciferase family)